jgi:glycosyltransferase involved in cell wall biosynthesis
MRILHVTPSFHPAQAYGGPTESVFQLCRHLARGGCEVRVLTTNADGLDRMLGVDATREVDAGDGLRVRYCRRLLRHTVSPGLLRRLPSSARWADLVHVTGTYSFPVIPTLAACRALGKPTVWSPRGALQRWVGSRRRLPKACWERVCRLVAPRRLILHVTSEQERAESVERLPGLEAAVIPNGVEIPERTARPEPNGVLRLLYLGRLDPKKGIENLLEACARLRGEAVRSWRLVIAGSGDSVYRRRLEQRTRHLELGGLVSMVGAVHGDDKQRLFANADLAVVPSYTENFGIVVAEALAHGVPVIASRGTPWKGLEETGCGLWVPNDPESLAKAIVAASEAPLRKWGAAGRSWMENEFSWPAVAARMLRLYSGLAGSR